jgi:hypothetical protein
MNVKIGKFPHSCIYLKIDPHMLMQQNRHTNHGNVEISHRHMNVEIGA